MAKSLGVYLTYILRHRPQDIGVAMDVRGWVCVRALLLKAKYVKPITFEMLVAEVDADEKMRFQFNADKTKIRCVQGHSVEHVLLHLKPYKGLEPLYHGTAEKNVPSILHAGILKQKRKHVHISRDVNTAKHVGQRHGAPVVFEIDTSRMVSDGYRFFVAENGVILTDHIPSRYIRQIDI